jgi:hypothetical protein
MKEASNFNFSNENVPPILKVVDSSPLPNLMVIEKNLKSLPDEYKRLEYLLTVKTEYEEGAHFCDLQIKKIKKLNKYKREFKAVPSQALQPSSSKSNNPELSLSQIALKYVWEGQCISNENCSEIAQQYGYTSGDALYNKYCTYSSAANRKASSDLSRKQLKNKINLFESVIDLLPESKKNKAREELDHLLNKLEEDF